jgi:hypothetical protein
MTLRVPAPRSFSIGVDLGKLRDFTAITTIERSSRYSHRDPVLFCDVYQWTNTVRRAERLRLGTSYPKAVEYISELVRDASRLGPVTLAVDSTGVGQPVVDALRLAGLPAELLPITITSGEHPSRSAHGHNVPKRNLLVNLQMIFARRDLCIPVDLPLRRRLIDELSAITTTLDAPGARHDDLALSLALAAWPLRNRPRIGDQPTRLL